MDKKYIITLIAVGAVVLLLFWIGIKGILQLIIYGAIALVIVLGVQVLWQKFRK